MRKIPCPATKACESCGREIRRTKDEAPHYFMRKRFCSQLCHGISISKPARERFLALIERTESGCWLWIGVLNAHGYGDFWMDGRIRRAHRAAWLIFRGPITPGLFVCHRCDRPACVNPDHLFLGSGSENMKDCARKGRLASQKSRARRQELFG